MTKGNNLKIAEIRYTDAQKQTIAQFVESDAFKVINTVIRPKRQIAIGQTGLRASLSGEDLFYYKGMLYESDWIVKEVLKVAEDYNRKQLDVDSDD